MIRKTTPQEVLAERNQATKDYHDDQFATRERTAKLRAERLARDAEELRNPQPKEPPVKGVAKVKAPAVRKAKSRST